jgi:hypothetical protein
MTGSTIVPPYALRLGVTGHRRLTDEPAIAGAVRGLLDRLHASFAREAAVPVAWTLVSPLAQGADRIVARAALERPGARLEVVLPLPVDEYRRDFTGLADAAAFDELLDRAARVVGPPCASAVGASREQAYLRAGQQVVDACEVLVAVWDGRPAAREGGTADVVRYALAQDRLVLWIDAEAPGAPAVVLAGVGWGAAAAGARLAVRTRPLPGAARRLSAGFDQHARFWSDASADPAALAAAHDAEARRLGHAVEAAGLPPGTLAPLLAAVLPHFVRADLLAVRYRRRHARALAGVLYLGATAITLAVAQVVFFPGSRWPTVLEVAAMATLLALWLLGRRRAWHLQWLNDRCLAERLRSALFTGLCGAPPAAADGALPFYRGPSQWIAAAAAQVAGAALPADVPLVDPRATRRFLLDAWLDHQRAFNEATATRKAAAAHRRHRLERALVGASFALACLHLAGVGHAAAGTPALVRPDAWITFLAIALLPWAGAVHAVTAQLELERMGERARHMARGLERIASRLAAAATPADVAACAHEAAELMSHETHEWWVLLSFQEARLHA